jgi:tRNA U34 5-methylaminomethyl-2-thiouridine-forming methyltransferase MnmC
VATRNEIVDMFAHALIGGKAIEEVGFGGRPEKSFPGRRAIMPIGPNSFLKGLNEGGKR